MTLDRVYPYRTGAEVRKLDFRVRILLYSFIAQPESLKDKTLISE
jgi:hypothetical protein